MSTSELDIVLQWGEYLLAADLIERLQAALCTVAPIWSRQTGTAIHADTETSFRVDLTAPGALRAGLQAIVDLPAGAAARRVRKTLGAAPGVAFGYGELKGTDDPSLSAFVIVHEQGIRPLGEAWVFGNSTSIRVRGATVDGEQAAPWVANALRVLCAATKPWYGRACLTSEFQAKNISTEGGGMRAVGIDVSKYLPGL
jgi:hypothetical protein